MKTIDPLEQASANTEAYLNTVVSQLSDHVVRLSAMTLFMDGITTRILTRRSMVQTGCSS